MSKESPTTPTVLKWGDVAPKATRGASSEKMLGELNGTVVTISGTEIKMTASENPQPKGYVKVHAENGDVLYRTPVTLVRKIHEVLKEHPGAVITGTVKKNDKRGVTLE